MGASKADDQVLMFCIGAQKAGTTWFERQLRNENNVYLARPKELHYWDCIRAPYLRQFQSRPQKRLHVPMAEDPLRYRLSRFWTPKLRERIAAAERFADIYRAGPYDHSKYLAYVGLNTSPARLVGDITPSYALLNRETYAEMSSCAPDVRFVFIMRDPVRRLWSGLYQYYRRDLMSGLASDRDIERRFDAICEDPLDLNMQRSNYLRTITELEASVPAARIHYCFYETLLDPVGGAQERAALADFLEVQPGCMNAEDKVHIAARRHTLSASRYKAARDHMDPIYTGLSEKFAARLPCVWGH